MLYMQVQPGIEASSQDASHPPGEGRVGPARLEQGRMAHHRVDLEYSLLKVPCETLGAHFQKQRKLVTRELGQVVTQFVDSENNPAAAPAGSVRDVPAMVERLKALRMAVVEAEAAERALLDQCQQKLQLLSSEQKQVPGDLRRSLDDGCKRQLERLIGEYLLRMGYFEGAELLEAEAGFQGLLDLDVVRRVKQVERALLERDCRPALSWCDEHSSKLRKIESVLPFQLHKQQFLELVRQGDRMAAVQYASEHLSTLATVPAHVHEIQQAMATLAFDKPEACPVPEYGRLFSEERWQSLASLFASEARKCVGLPDRTSLELCLQVGLSCLKTPMCYDDEQKNMDCPVCSQAGRALAAPLPFAHFGNSHLRCRCTGDTMDESNRPLVLPNGHVYSTRAIKELLTRADGKVVCPRTGDTFPASEVQTIYII